MKRAVIYVRVSTAEQAEGGYSIEAQLEACRRYVREQGWSLAAEYVDAGKSATTASRPKLQEMLSSLVSGDPVSYVVVHKIDRLARNTLDHLGIRARLKKQDISLVSVTENLEDTPAGRMVETIIASVSAWYSENLGQEARKGMAQKARNGLWPSMAPLGYLNVRSGTGRRGESTLEIDPERGPLIRQAFDLYATGNWTLTTLQAELTTRGLRTRTGRPVSRSKLALTLRHKIYIGIVSWAEVEQKGVHQPLVPDETFDRVQMVFRDHDKAGPRLAKHNHYLRGSLYCASCGSKLTTTVAKGRFSYFFCVGTRAACRQRYVRVEEIDRQVTELYGRLRVSDKGLSRVRASLDAEIAKQTLGGAAAAARHAQRLARLQAEREMLLQAYYDKAISTDVLKTEQVRIDHEEEEIRNRVSVDRTALVKAKDLGERALRVLTECRSAYPAARDDLRRSWNRALFRAIYVGDGVVTRLELREPLQALFAAAGSNSVQSGEGRGIRTLDQGIKSPLLYR